MCQVNTYYVLGPGVLPPIRPHLQVASQLMTEAGILSHPTEQAHGHPREAGTEGKEAAG